jgi:hypothetical protein
VADTDPDISQLARVGLDLDRLRSGQQQAIDAAVAGRDVLAVMPTGYGKSAIYKLVGAATEGCTVVVSPLVALQRDQVEGLAEEDVGVAVQVNATIADGERAGAWPWAWGRGRGWWRGRGRCRGVAQNCVRVGVAVLGAAWSWSWRGRGRGRGGAPCSRCWPKTGLGGELAVQGAWRAADGSGA